MLKKYSPTFDHNVTAIQFFRSKVRSKALSEVVEKVWADHWDECFVRYERHKKADKKYTVEYVVKDCNQYLRDGNWILISSNGYASIESDQYFKLAYREIK